MTKKTKLSDIVEQIEFVSDDVVVYLDRRKGTFHLITDDIQIEIDTETPLEELDDWMREDVAVGRSVEQGDDEHLVALPTSYDIHEYEIMEEFCRAQSNHDLSKRLSDAISGRGAFRRFKDLVHQLGVEQESYRFRDREMEKIAIQWCQENNIPYEK